MLILGAKIPRRRWGTAGERLRVVAGKTVSLRSIPHPAAEARRGWGTRSLGWGTRVAGVDNIPCLKGETWGTRVAGVDNIPCLKGETWGTRLRSIPHPAAR